MALNLDGLIMSDEDDIKPMKEPPLFNISKDTKRNSFEDNSSGSDSSYCEFAKESAKTMTTLIDEVQLAKIEKNERIANARKQKKKELDEKKNLYQRGKNFNKKDNTSNSDTKFSSSKSSNKKIVNTGNVQTFCDNDHNKSSSSANQNLKKGANENLTKELKQQQNQNKVPTKNKKINEKPKITPKLKNITIQDFGIESTDSSDYESDCSSNNLSDNELLKSRAAAKLFTVKNLNESNFYFVDVDSSSDSDNGKKNIKHFQSYAKRMSASKRSKNLNKKRSNYNKNIVQTVDTNDSKNISGHFFLKDNIVENPNKIISNDKTTENRSKIISKDKKIENRNKTKFDQNPSTSKQNVQNQDGKLQSNFIPSTSKSLLQDLFEQTRQKNTDKPLTNTSINQKYDQSAGQSNDKEVKNNSIEIHKNKIERNTVKDNNQESGIKSKDSKKKNKKKKELRTTDGEKNVEKTKESKSIDNIKKVEKLKDMKTKDQVKKVEKIKGSKSTVPLNKFEKTIEQKCKAVEQREIALSKANNQRIFSKNRFDDEDDDIVILSEVKLKQNKPEIINEIDDTLNIDNLILDSYTSSSYHHNESINSSNIDDKSKIIVSDSESDIDFNTILNERKKKIENVITDNKTINNSKNNDSIVNSNLKFKPESVLNESSSDLEAEFEASLQFNYRNKFKK